MRFLTPLQQQKLVKDAERLLLSPLAVTVTLQWTAQQVGQFDTLFHQYDGVPIKNTLDVQAHKTILTEPMLKRLGFGTVKVGDVVFRFSRSTDLVKTDLVIIHNAVTYYPVLLNPTEQELLESVVGEVGLFKAVLGSKVKPRTIS